MLEEPIPNFPFYTRRYFEKNSNFVLRQKEWRTKKAPFRHNLRSKNTLLRNIKK